MIKDEARKQLNRGYIYLLAGFILGLFFLISYKINDYFTSLLLGYISWSIYWGYKIYNSKISKHFSSFFNAPVHIEAKDTYDYFSKSISYKIFTEFIKFWICYLIGVFGGAIYKQIQLSRIAYFKYD